MKNYKFIFLLAIIFTLQAEWYKEQVQRPYSGKARNIRNISGLQDWISDIKNLDATTPEHIKIKFAGDIHNTREQLDIWSGKNAAKDYKFAILPEKKAGLHSSRKATLMLVNFNQEGKPIAFLLYPHTYGKGAYDYREHQFNLYCSDNEKFNEDSINQDVNNYQPLAGKPIKLIDCPVQDNDNEYDCPAILTYIKATIDYLERYEPTFSEQCKTDPVGASLHLRTFVENYNRHIVPTKLIKKINSSLSL